MPNHIPFFHSLFEIVQTLYFALYGLVDIEKFHLREPHVFTQFVGKLMFGTYSGISVIILLNMLIAMLSTSYLTISVSAPQGLVMPGKNPRKLFVRPA